MTKEEHYELEDLMLNCDQELVHVALENRNVPTGRFTESDRQCIERIRYLALCECEAS